MLSITPIELRLLGKKAVLPEEFISADLILLIISLARLSDNLYIFNFSCISNTIA
jgi:hypothetical protein